MRLRGYLLLFLFLLTGCGRSGPGDPIYIGHLAPLQATDKSRFEHARQGMALAIEEQNQKPSATPRRPFAVLHVNADEDLDQLQASAVRLLTVNRAVALIGGRDAAHVERLTRAAQPYETPLITQATIASYLATDFLYSLEPSPARLAKVIGRWLAESIKGEELAFAFDSRSPVAAALATALRGELQPLAKGKLHEVPFNTPLKAKDTGTSIQQSKAKAWVFFGKTEDWLALRQELRDTSCKLSCLVLDGVGPIEVLPQAGAQEGELFQLTTYFLPEQEKASSEFLSNYAKHFHSDPDLYAAQGYDAVRMIIDASAAGKTTPGGKLAVELNSFIKAPFASTTGPLTFESTDHSARRVLFLLQQTAQRPKLLFKAEPPPST